MSDPTVVSARPEDSTKSNECSNVSIEPKVADGEDLPRNVTEKVPKKARISSTTLKLDEFIECLLES